MTQTQSRPADAAVNLEMRDITVRYGSFTANDKISLKVRHGQTVALLGENGAGKTTLMKVLAGLLKPIEGEILIDGKKTDISSPLESQRLGIGMVHQHFMLIPTLTVAQNVCIGLKSAGYPFPDIKKVERELSEISEKYNLRVDPKMKVSDLSIGTQQRAEILKVLYRGADILILDEPTSVLTPQETEGLFEIIRFLTAHDNSVIFISHKLGEVMEISDRITVLRQGKVTAELDAKDTNERELARLMVGRDFAAEGEKTPVPEDAPEVVRVEGVTYTDSRKVQMLKGVDLNVRAGEIHGVAGVDGNGQLELSKVIVGLLKASSGKFILNGKDMTHASPRARQDAGLTHIPADRQHLGLVMDLSMKDNFILEISEKAPISKNGMLNEEAIRAFSEELVEKYDIRCTSIDQPAGTLSGGNQQKLVFSRELSRNPVFILAMQPTRGLDIGATEFVHEKLLEQRNQGCAILLISTELDEIMELSDRISVMYSGRIVKTIPGAGASREEIGLYMTGKSDDWKNE